MNSDRPAASAQTQAARAEARPLRLAQPPRMVDSEALLNGQSLLLIRHFGEVYRLQTTRQGKLILTK